MSTQTYIHVFVGDFWVQERNFQIEINMPTRHRIIACAKNDSSSAQFEKHNGNVVLVIYSDWEQGMLNGKWHEGVKGKVLDIIQWEEWYKYQMSQAKGKGIAGMGNDGVSGYIPCATNWNELFDVNSLSDDWGNSVESLAYRVIAYIDC